MYVYISESVILQLTLFQFKITIILNVVFRVNYQAIRFNEIQLFIVEQKYIIKI